MTPEKEGLTAGYCDDNFGRVREAFLENLPASVGGAVAALN